MILAMKQKEYDDNIIAALKKLPVPLKTFDGHDVVFEENKRHETIFQHVANKKHHLHIVDIILIQSILLNKNSLVSDRNGHKYRTYIGRRTKKKERLKYIKITTKIRKNNQESVITIHAVKNNS